MNEWFGVEAPYSDTEGDIESYDPTLSLLITVPGMYFLSAIAFAVTAVVIKPHFDSLHIEDQSEL